MTDALGTARGCFMAQGLYLKANGEMPCWDDVGEAKILRVLDPGKLARGEEHAIAGYGEMLRIRQSFMDGHLPNPGLCERCAVRGAGLPVTELNPTTLQVLHVEPSYLCQLSCPQCIAPRERKDLKGPPYHLTPEMYEGFLRQIRAEGVEHIRLVVFEGRGDPLASPHLREIIELTKAYYPRSHTCATTHGSYPVRPWIVACGLDMIRFSVDGAFQHNYERYRIGGKLHLIHAFMAFIRDTPKPDGTNLYTEWKYILFEWNDGDDEIRHAAHLAGELHVKLRFCRTHTPGRSRRYETAADVADMIARLAPAATPDLTFQLKGERDYAEVEAVRVDRITGLLRVAQAHTEAAREAEACAAIASILAVDADAVLDEAPLTYGEAASLIERHAATLMVPQTASSLASLAPCIGAGHLAVPLLERYLTLAPGAPDHDHVRRDIAVRSLTEAAAAGEHDRATGIAIRIIGAGPAPADPVLAYLGQALTASDPGVVVALANFYLGRGHNGPATLLFERYLELAPAARERAHITAAIDRLRAEQLFARAAQEDAAGRHADASRLLLQALAHNPSLRRPDARE